MVIVGVKAFPFITPSDHVYVDAPVPFNTTLLPAQIVADGETVAPTAGK